MFHGMPAYLIDASFVLKTNVVLMYLSNDKVSETVSDNIIAFPAEWRGKHIGKNLIMRNNREAVFKKLSEEDINEVGTPVNESVSSMLPDRQELENELKELLQSM